jgi:transposase
MVGAVDHYSIREISRREGLSRNTVRKYLAVSPLAGHVAQGSRRFLELMKGEP